MQSINRHTDSLSLLAMSEKGLMVSPSEKSIATLESFANNKDLTDLIQFFSTDLLSSFMSRYIFKEETQPSQLLTSSGRIPLAD